MKLQIRVGEDGVINEVKFKTFGCGSAIASSSYMTERVKGMTLDQAGAVKNTEIAKELCLPPVKCESSFLRFQYSIMPKMRFGWAYPVAFLGVDWGDLFSARECFADRDFFFAFQCTALSLLRMLSSLPSRTTRPSEHSDLQLPTPLLLLHRHNLNRLLPKREIVLLVGFRMRNLNR